METTTFVELLRQTVIEPAIRDTLSQIEHPSGRNPSDDRKSRASWLHSLSSHERQHVEYVVREAVLTASFGLFCVLDGARVIEDPPHRGHLELRYVKDGSHILLASSAADAAAPLLHELL